MLTAPVLERQQNGSLQLSDSSELLTECIPCSSELVVCSVFHREGFNLNADKGAEVATRVGKGSNITPPGVSGVFKDLSALVE